LAEAERRAEEIAQQLLRKHKGRALKISFGLREGRLSKLRMRMKGMFSKLLNLLFKLKNNKKLKRIGKELYLFFALDEVEKSVRKLKGRGKRGEEKKGIRIKLPKISIKKEIGSKIQLPPPPEGIEIPFPGGKLILNGTEAIYYPHSYPDHLIQVHILARMLRGIYPETYENQGDLLWKSVELRKERASAYLEEIGVKNEELALEGALRSTKLWPTLAIMMAEDVTEGYAFLGSNLILDHIIHGRIRVKNYVFDEEELEKFKTFIEADINAGFEFRKSLAEVDITLGRSKFRIALDIPPASRGSLDIRNLSAISKLSLPRLIKLGSINEEEASTILKSIELGLPILIFGRTGVGKTTLANALLACLPKGLRLISVEEVREIEDLSIYGQHHSPYEVSGKFDFIRFLLHRNPDVVFLGEILTKEAAEAFQLAYSSGLKVIATTHARGFPELVEKWESFGQELPRDTLAILMRDKRVVEMRRWNDGWHPVDMDSDYLDFLRKLEGADTNEDVASRK